MAKVMGKPKDLGDIPASWKKLLYKVGSEGDDFIIFSIVLRTEIKYFHARVKGQYIVVDRARKHLETAQINEERTIDFNQFGCVAHLYNEYVLGNRGIRPMMRDNCGQNTSYIISLISRLL